MKASDLIVVAEPWQWAALVAMTLVLTGALYAWGKDRPTPTLLLAFLRAASLATLGFLLLEPMLRMESESEERPVLPILVDASASQWLGADSTERREAVAALVDQMRTWGEPWDWETELFAFDRDTRPLDTWNPQGKRTNLGGALQTMKDRYVHRNVPAMVLVTDGRANRGPNPEFGVDLLDVPLFVVGTGDTSAIKDVELTRVRLNDVAYLGNGFPVEVTVRSRDMVDVPLTLSVTVDGARVTVKDATWTPSKIMDSHAWSLQLSSDRPGPLSIRASVSSDGSVSEASLENNARTETIDILESRRRVLFLARAPHPDLAALRAAAETNRHQQTEVVWTEDLANGMVLPEHDVVVLHHMEPSFMPSGVLEALDGTNAVWFLGHSETDWNQWSGEAVGFQMEAEPLVTEAQGLANEAFESFPLPAGLDGALALWPPLAAPTGQYNVTPSFQAVLHQQVGPVKTTWPLWGIRKGNELRTAVTLGEGLWRWRMQDMARHDGMAVTFDALVNGTLQFLSSRDDVKRLRVVAPERIDEDLRCVLRAEVYDASLSPSKEADVRLSLQPRGGLSTNHAFVARGLDWELDLGTLLPGVYDWTATCDQAGDMLTERGVLVVNAVQAEATLQPANHSLLRRMAEATQGSFLGALSTSNDLDALQAQWSSFAGALEAPSVIHRSTERLPLHLQPWLLVLLLVLLASEWAIRRAGGGR